MGMGASIMESALLSDYFVMSESSLETVSANASKKYYVVTGATGTIGKSIVNRLINDNAYVIGTYFHGLRFSVGPNQALLYLDLNDIKSIERVVQIIECEYGMIDGLVNCAGVNIPKSFDKVTIDDLDVIFNINVRGTFLLTQRLIGLIKNKGAIVNVGSLSAKLGGPISVHYAMSKAALEAFTVGVAKFVANRYIRCNLVIPGFIDSVMLNKSNSSTLQKLIESIPMNALGTPDEVANVVAFLLSDQSNYITGAKIEVTGGL